MTPSHSNRDGVRYRYYVSPVLLQRREKDAGRVTRVPAVQLEKPVVEAIRAKAQHMKDDLSDRAVLLRHAHHRPPGFDRHRIGTNGDRVRLSTETFESAE
jgi:hypothetical protein